MQLLIMESILNEKNAVAFLERYFSSLKNTGYISGHTTCKFLLYLFLIDFADVMFTFLDDEDYRKIYALTSEIFSDGGCMLPYPSACEKKLKAGMPYVMRAISFRKTEILNGGDLRKSEDENLRRV